MKEGHSTHDNKRERGREGTEATRRAACPLKETQLVSEQIHCDYQSPTLE